jgi:quercetin dioxygenase-like cupin family protein
MMFMDINTDFTKRVLIHSEALNWLPSPIPGVERRMLDRIGGEVARVTSIVRYAPQTEFPFHTHDGGEEVLILDGIFEDEHGTYPAGTYIRKPPTSQHTAGSKSGCTIFVKLWQFDLADRKTVVTDVNAITPIRAIDRKGVVIYPLFEDHRERVQVEAWDPSANVELEHFPS